MSIAALIEAVEAGKCWLPDSEKWDDIGVNGRAGSAAFHGSLDAALALHNAVLPGIMWVRSPNGQFCLFDRNAEEVSYSFEKDSNPARAWLLAILRAKEAGQ